MPSVARGLLFSAGLALLPTSIPLADGGPTTAAGLDRRDRSLIAKALNQHHRVRSRGRSVFHWKSIRGKKKLADMQGLQGLRRYDVHFTAETQGRRGGYRGSCNIDKVVVPGAKPFIMNLIVDVQKRQPPKPSASQP